MKRDAVMNPPLKVLSAVTAVTAAITHNPECPMAAMPR